MGISDWCTDCSQYHYPDDVDKCPKLMRADALEEILLEVRRQEANARLDDQINYQLRHG